MKSPFEYPSTCSEAMPDIDASRPYLEVASAAAERAGELLRQHFANLAGANATVKQNEQGYDGIVTQADLEAEETIVGIIGQQFPEHEFLAEESFAELIDKQPKESATTEPQRDAESDLVRLGAAGATDQRQDSVAATDRARELPDLWIVDPLDGTNNFAHGIDHYAVSIAHYRYGVAQVGLILKPQTGQRYWAVRGQGAFFQSPGEPPRGAKVNQHAQLSETMVAVGFYYDRGALMQATLATIQNLFRQQIHGIRRMGTAALDIVQVGTGSFGAFFEYQLSPWDFAAARLFLEEAGGRITTCENVTLPIGKTSVLASNGHLHELMLPWMQPPATVSGER